MAAIKCLPIRSFNALILCIFSVFRDCYIVNIWGLSIKLYQFLDILLLLLYPRHLCRRVYSFRFSVRMFVGSFVRSLVRSLFRNVRGIYVKVFVGVQVRSLINIPLRYSEIN